MRNAAAAGFVALYFIWFAGPWIHAGFTPDDLMNGHRALQQPLGKLLLDHVTVYLPTPEYRPLGSLFYRILYRIFGFNPFPFHVALYAVLAANIYLTYEVTRRITGASAAAWAAAVFHAWHGNWRGLHLSFGFSFDVLCYFFYAAALIAFGARRHWTYFGLYLLALNSKEVAVSLPVVCLLWRGTRSARDATAAIGTGVITAFFIGGRLLTPAGLGAIDSYAPRFDWKTLLDHVTTFLEMAAYGRSRLGWAVAILCCAALWGLLRHRPATVVALAIAAVGMLPVAFIPQRSLESMYLPGLGVAILLALPLADAVKQRPYPALALALLLAGTFHYVRRERNPDGPLAEAHHIANVAAQIRRAAPCLAPGSHILFHRDPFPQFDWNSYFLIRLLYDNPAIEVDRPGRHRFGPVYDYVFDWDPGGGGPGQGVLRRSNLDATNASTTPNSMPSK